MIAKWALALGGIGLALGCAQVAAAASFAVLVGVSDYEDDTGIADLRGPVNDVILLRDALSARGDFAITLLADGLPGAARPTRAAILGALEDLQSRVTAGDFVFIHMSGHGTQQPDENGDESDGLDEVFLPADTRKAPPGSRSIPNAIVDEEIGALVAALRALGADVWFVLDSCHSGSGLRAGSPDVATRFVDPATLGVRTGSALRGRSDPVPLDPALDADLPGKYLAFYAAQSSELARELEVDPKAASGNGWYGLFTSRLAARLTQDSPGTYRQLFQAVMSDMSSADLPGGARLQTPLWEGNLIDGAVFGGSETIGLRQYAVTEAQLAAGLLHGLDQGALVGLVEDAATPEGAHLAVAQIVSASAQSSQLALVDETCVADANALCPPQGVIPPEARFARVIARPVDLTLRFGVPVDLTTGAPIPAEHPLHHALNTTINRVNIGATARVELVTTGADITVGVYDGALWFGSQVSSGASPIGLAWHPESGAELQPLLERIFAAERVARMLDSVGGSGSVLFGNPVDVRLRVRDTNMANRPPSLADQAAIFEECKSALQTAELRQVEAVEAFDQCDQLEFKAQGAFAGGARDVNRVYIDSQFCVKTTYARVEGTAQATRVGPPLTLCSDCPAPDGIERKAGYERVFMVVTEAANNAEALDLRGVLDTCREDAASQTRSVDPNSNATAFLRAMSKRAPLRSQSGGFGITNLWVTRFDWIVLPRSEALAREGMNGE